MTQAVEDGATRPVYYESRVIHLKGCCFITRHDAHVRPVAGFTLLREQVRASLKRP